MQDQIGFHAYVHISFMAIRQKLKKKDSMINYRIDIVVAKDPVTLRLKSFTRMKCQRSLHNTPIEDEPFIIEVFDSMYDSKNFAQFHALALQTSLNIFDELVLQILFEKASL